MATVKKFLPLAAVLLASFVLRLGVMAAVIEPRAAASVYAPFYFPDSGQFWELGSRLRTAGIFADAGSRYAWRTPLYPLLLAAGQTVAGESLRPHRVLNIIFDVLNVFLLCRLACLIFSPRAGFFAALGGALYPFQIFTAPLILCDTLAHTAVLAAMLALYHCQDALALQENRRPGRRKNFIVPAIFLGLALAGAALVKTSLGLLVIPAAGYLFWRAQRENNLAARRRFAAAAIIAPLVFAAAMSGWWGRNYQIFQTFVPFSTMGGFTLWESSGIGADGGANHGKVTFPEPWKKMTAHLEAQGAGIAGDVFPADRDGLSHLPLPSSAAADSGQTAWTLPGTTPLELAADRYLQACTFHIWRQDPLRALQLSGRKFFRTWNIIPNWEGAGNWFYRAAMLLSYLPVLLLALGSIRVFYPRRAVLLLLWLPVLYIAGVHCVFMGSVRYRLPAEGCLLVLAAGTFDWIWGKISLRNNK